MIKKNYNLEMEKIIDTLPKNKKPTLLLQVFVVLLAPLIV